MQNLVWKFVLIFAILGLCVYAMYPPKQKIRLGKDLQGGYSLVYLVDMPPDLPNKAEVLSQTIEVLKDRVNPQGVLDISMQPMGLDRIEIVSPLPSDEVKALKRKYDDALAALKVGGQISESQLDDAIRFNRAPAELGGGDAVQASKIKDLQNAYNVLQDAKTALAAAREAAATQPAQSQPATTEPSVQPPSPQQQLYALENRVVDAQEHYEGLRAEVLSQNLDQARIVRTITMSNERKEKTDVTGKRLLDDKGNPQLEPSPRELALQALKAQFSQAATKIDAAVAAYDEYQGKRTTLDDPEDLMRLLRGAGVLEFRIVVRNGSPEGVNIQSMKQQLAESGPTGTDSTVAAWFPINSIKEWAEEPEAQARLEADPESYFSGRNMVASRYNGQIYVLLYTTPAKAMTHSTTSQWTVESTGRTTDRLGRAAVSFRLDPAGGSLMSKLTGPHVGQQMAIVLDGQVYTAPGLNSQIGNAGIIEGQFSPEDINYLIRVLAAGSLSARLGDTPISISTLGPSIGADNLARGLKAFVLSILVTAGFMLTYYFFAGIVANIALFCNAIVIFGVMALINGSFTLPGLAGIALSVAMAVDANVLIYERIREELVNNKEDLRTAIRLGYSRAMSAIIDGNVTHLITCVVLLYTATAEVKGFALTMILGVCATLFTALFITRVLFTVYTEILGAKKLPMLATVFPGIHRALEPSFDWIAWRKVFYGFSIIITLVALALVFSLGKRILDTEFRGGVALTMQTRLAAPGEPADTEGRLWLSRPEVEKEIHALGEAASPDQAALRELRTATVLTMGEAGPNYTATRFQVKVSNPPSAQSETAVNETVQTAIAQKFADRLDVTPKLNFTGRDDPEHARYTSPIENDTLGANIGMPEHTESVRPFRGGVAIVIRDINPPATADKIKERIERLSEQPDFASTRGRSVEVFSLQAADPNDSSKGATAVVVTIFDPDLNLQKVDMSLWDSQLAASEWKRVSTALATGSSFEEVSSFSSAIARTLAANAIVAVILSLIGMLVYIWVRFGSLRYSVATVVAVGHDVLVCLGAIALTHYISGTKFASMLMLQDFRIDLNVVAALLTIIGYSLNDTIVILDRIRENRGKRLFATRKIVNDSVNQTFSRTILTGGSTIVASIILYVLGGTGIQPFAFCFLVGLITGTYSSVAIAAPLVVRPADETPTPPATGLAVPAREALPAGAAA